MMLYFLLILLFFQFTSKIYQENVHISRFKQSNNWVYLTKMNFNPGQSKIESQINLFDARANIINQKIKIAIISSDQWPKQLQNKCFNSNSKYLLHPLSVSGPSYTFQRITVQQKSVYYFVIKDCENKFANLQSQLIFQIKLKILNNNLHASEDQDNTILFPIMVFFGLGIVYQIKKSYSQDQQIDWIKLILLIGSICEISSLFWKAIDHYSYINYGKQLFFFDFCFLGLKSLSQSIFMILINLIAYGWTINYKQNKNFDIYIPLMCLIGSINVLITILTKINDGQHDKSHLYDSIVGYVLIGFRVVILIVFFYGICNTYSKTHIKKKNFLINFSIFGCIYILSLPIFMIINEVYIQEYNQQKMIFLMTQSFQLITITILSYMIISKNSSYSLISLQNSSFLSNQKFF